MYYPALNTGSSRAVNVPALSGGVNLSDPLNLVEDNQLTDMKNLWYMDGNLKTRPAVRFDKMFDLEPTGLTQTETIYSVEFTQFIDGTKYTAIISKGQRFSAYCIFLTVFSEKGALFTATATFSIKNKPETEVVFAGKPTVEGGTGIYMLVTDETGYVCLYEVVTDTDDNKSLHRLTSEELYTPTVYINGKMDSYSTLPASEGEEYAAASFFEGYSAFSDAWASYYYTSDGVSVSLSLPVSFDSSTVYVEYNIPKEGGTIEKLTFGPASPSANGHKITCNENSDYYIGLTSHCNEIMFFKKNPNYIPGTESIETMSEYNQFCGNSALGVYTNNIVVKLKPDNLTNTVLAGMRFGTWFGGTAGGIHSGTRLFLSGSEKNKNLLVWSDLNNPTYFSENNYAYVGEATQRITALEKQSDMLVIFKENEMFYTLYTEGETYTAKEVRDGKVIDVSTLSATFPMIQIHSEIGCDIPASIKLCGDRLVWACKDRHVYMLKSANQYSNCNISPISKMIDRALARVTDEELNKATACMYKGHYLLSFGTKTFVLNYDYYYFKSLPSYSDSNRAQKKLIWYIWELPINSIFLYFSAYFWDWFTAGEECYISFCYAGGLDLKTRIAIHKFDFDKNYDFLDFPGFVTAEESSKKLSIKSVLQTKLFDFGAMDRFKKIEQLYIGFGEKTEKARIEYVTDRGRADGGIVDISGESDEYSPEYIKTKRFLPNVNRSLKFGIRLESEGRIALDGILIKYKFMGVKR